MLDQRPLAGGWNFLRHEPRHLRSRPSERPISKGDYEKVLAFLRTNRSVTDFNLISPGGDVNEALKIGRLFRKYLFSTTAPRRLSGDDTYLAFPRCSGPNCGTCASACALIWFGGVDREGSVGLHRPRIDDPMFSGLPPADASTAYRQVLNRIVVYLDEMEVPKSVIESMVATSSGDIRWVEAVDDRLDQPPSIAEWAKASCGLEDAYTEAIRNGTYAQLTSGQREALERAYGEKLKCEGLLFDQHRDRLTPP